ncbi:hypothetical protein [Nannocystis pusilla]|uniref:hypothetical protein n=1 Tax=Nannocystis pusilla TaxID=889268 RepID=UPI003DA53BAA
MQTLDVRSPIRDRRNLLARRSRRRQCTFHRGAEHVELRQRGDLTAKQPGIRENLPVSPLGVRAHPQLLRNLASREAHPMQSDEFL